VAPRRCTERSLLLLKKEYQSDGHDDTHEDHPDDFPHHSGRNEIALEAPLTGGWSLPTASEGKKK
jgi:hypothetical protein